MRVKNSLDKLRIVFLCLGLFLTTVAFLLGSSIILNITENKLALASNLADPSPAENLGQVTGVSKENTIEIKLGNLEPPKFSSAAVLAEDVNLNKILFSKNSHSRLSPASTTKIMSALVANEHFKPADILTVPSAALVGGSDMGLYAGESLTFRSLLYGMLLNSGNDAAYTIAMNYPGGLEGFVNRMNQKAVEMKLSDTHFQNPAGFDGSNHYSSAHDLAEIAKEVIKDPSLGRIVSTKETSVVSVDQLKYHPLKNLNKLLGEPGVIGVKTGFTQSAGENLVGLVERDGHRILTVVLSSADRFGESRALIDWIFKNFSWVQ